MGIEPDTSRIAVLYAVPEERRYFDSTFESLEVVHGTDGLRPRPQSGASSARRPAVCSLCIGVGIPNAARNTVHLLETDRLVRTLIVVGFAGGLRSSLTPGCVVVAESVIDVASKRAYSSDPKLLAAAAEVRLPAVSIALGPLATSARVLVRAAEKLEAARSTDAIAVDMESAGVAGIANRYGVPWLAVRVITDGVDDDLPLDFNALAGADGSIDRSRVLAGTLLHPWKIPALIRLGVRSSLGARNLAAFLHSFLARLANP